MPANATTRTASRTVNCAKCQGTGRVDWVGNYANGVCFDCGGSGKLDFDAPTVARIRQEAANQAMWCVEISMAAIMDGNPARATHYAKSALDGLFAAGTELARGVLAHVAAGRFYCDDTRAHIQMNPADALALRTEIVELGVTASVGMVV